MIPKGHITAWRARAPWLAGEPWKGAEDAAAPRPPRRT